MKNQRGFTIVEVLFVLAIAGVILLLVFDAIPALSRSSRNTQRKEDVTTMLRAVSQYELKDSGNFPLACSAGNCESQVGSSNDYFLQYAKDKITIYDVNNIALIPQTITTRADQNGPANVDKVQIYNYEKCSTTTVGKADIAAAGYNDVVALYDLENGSGTMSAQCQQL